MRNGRVVGKLHMGFYSYDFLQFLLDVLQCVQERKCVATLRKPTRTRDATIWRDCYQGYCSPLGQTPEAGLQRETACLWQREH